jgi:hypothetical protein
MKKHILFLLLLCLSACDNSTNQQPQTSDGNTNPEIQSEPKQINIFHSYTDYSMGTNAVCAVLKLNSDGTYLHRIGTKSELKDPLVIQNDDEVLSHYSIGNYTVSGNSIVFSPKKGFRGGNNNSCTFHVFKDKVTLIFNHQNDYREFHEDDNGTYLETGIH